MSEILLMAFGALRTNKLRSMLTMSGVAIGVFSVIGVMTAVSAMRGSIETGLSFLGANIFQFARFPSGISFSDDREKYLQRRRITLDQAQRYQALMEGKARFVCLKAFENNAVAQAVSQGHKTNPGITFGGSDDHFIDANQYAIGIGRNLNPGDVELASPVALIGTDIAHRLFPSENPLGKPFKVEGHSFRVVGVFASKGSSFGQNQDDIVIVPITRFLADNGADGYSVNIATQASTALAYGQTLDRGMLAIRIVRGLRPEQENDFELYSNDSLIAAFSKVADIIGAGAFVISGIALLAAGVGIMNIMLVSVTERTREIGIRKAIGARKGSILGQFLAESTAISLAGGVAGILMGAAAGDAVAAAFKAGVIFPWGWATAAVLACSAIGLVFGLYPAWKAASMDPIEALRYE